MTTHLKNRFSVKDTIIALWLHEASIKETNPKSLYDLYKDDFEIGKGSYDYIARIAKELENDGLLSMSMDKHLKFYRTTLKGKETLKKMNVQYDALFKELQLVLDRIYNFISNTSFEAVKPENELPVELRTYFSKLISVKDLVRYMVFHLCMKRTESYPAEINEYLKLYFGWHVSSGYLYDIIREMEVEGTIIGHWKDSEKRTVRLIRITEDGVVFSKRITEDLFYQIKQIRKYIQSMLNLLK